jgi:hypothetical protein
MSIKCITRRQELRTHMVKTACQWPRLRNHLQTSTRTLACRWPGLHNHLRTSTRTLACQWRRQRLHLHPLAKSAVHLAGVPAAVAHVGDGRESAGSFSSSSWRLLRLPWWWHWSSLSQYKMAKTERDMAHKNVQGNTSEGGRVL